MNDPWSDYKAVDCMHPVISALHGKKRYIVFYSDRGCFSLTLLCKFQMWNLRRSFAGKCLLRSHNIRWYLFSILQIHCFPWIMLKITEFWAIFRPIKSGLKLHLHEWKERILFLVYMHCKLLAYSRWSLLSFLFPCTECKNSGKVIVDRSHDSWWWHNLLFSVCRLVWLDVCLKFG